MNKVQEEQAKSIMDASQKAKFNMATRQIRKDENSHEAYGMRAKILVDIGMKELALEDYGMAIGSAHAKDKAGYLASRSKLYTDMGKTDLALQDIRTISTLPKDAGITGIFVRNTISEILENTRQQVEQLKVEGKINKELAAILDKYTETAGKRLQQLPDRQLQEIYDQMASMGKALSSLQEGQKLGEAEVKKLRQNVEILEERVDEHDTILTSFGNSMDKLSELAIQADSEVEALGKKSGELEQKAHAFQKKMDLLIQEKQVSDNDIKIITENVRKLTEAGNVTAQALDGLYQDLEKVISRQDEAEEKMDVIEHRVVNLETMNKSFEELKIKTGAASGINAEDRQLMLDSIEALQKKVATLADKETVDKITESVTDLITKGKITRNKLASLQEDIDDLISKGNETTLNIMYHTWHDNPLLNYPEFVGRAVKIFGFDKALRLGKDINQDLLAEAAQSEDADMILAGLLSLDESIS